MRSRDVIGHVTTRLQAVDFLWVLHSDHASIWQRYGDMAPQILDAQTWTRKETWNKKREKERGRGRGREGKGKVEGKKEGKGNGEKMGGKGKVKENGKGKEKEKRERKRVRKREMVTKRGKV